jgi:hypothetical protein
MIPAFTTNQISKRHFSKCRDFLPPTLKGVNTIFFRAFSLLAITRSGSCRQSAIDVWQFQISDLRFQINSALTTNLTL